MRNKNSDQQSLKKEISHDEENLQENKNFEKISNHLILNFCLFYFSAGISKSLIGLRSQQKSVEAF